MKSIEHVRDKTDRVELMCGERKPSTVQHFVHRISQMEYPQNEPNSPLSCVGDLRLEPWNGLFKVAVH
jgi:hypothetical protein